ncbi:MAG: cytochrome P450 [Acidimicrobiaceae bacterium]|nr:cytochrome P450 [Acidimicrobiaceae bacterium]MYG99892.1 cytochrome P450 [Acidimicrobiaceae bacterium]MYL03380.1 cytochrome P450 [Acidimicrobiaceae bacterium]
MAITPVDPRPLDILDGDFYVNDPYSRYAWLRDNSPCHWDDINELWVLTRYDDIVEVEKDKLLFISSDREKGGYRPNLPADQSIIGTDDPLHQARRSLVSRRFTPRAVQRWRGHVTETVDGLLDPVLERGRAEIVDDLAAPLPAKMIGLLLGYDDDLWPKLKHWSEASIATGGGPRYRSQEGVEAVLEFAVACTELYTTKQGCPAGDLMSRWIQVESDQRGMVGGSPFGLDQIVSDSLLLLDGGAETTRTVIARTLLDLADRPDAWAALKAGADLEVAVEEFIRWVTPIHNMCRTATADTELGGQTVRKGQQVVMMYPSANRDPAHFADPETYDVARSPNNHIAFGFGTHFCLGAALARLEIQVFFERLLERVDRIERIEGTPQVEMPNAFVHGLLEAHLAFTPA